MSKPVFMFEDQIKKEKYKKENPNKGKKIIKTIKLNIYLKIITF